MSIFIVVLFSQWIIPAESVWHGRILDAMTGQPVAQALVFHPGAQTISNDRGEFSIVLKGTTTVGVRHLAYETLRIEVDPEHLPATLYLFPAVRELQAVEVSPFPSESALKNMVLESPYLPNALEQSLQFNLQMIKAIQPFVQASPNSSYKDFLQRVTPDGSGGAMFFNSRGGGLIKAFRELSRPSYPIPFRQNVQSEKPRFKLFHPVTELDSMRKENN